MAQDKSFSKFLTVWSGQFLSMVGSGLTGFALGVYAFERTQMATSTALVILLSFVPSLLLRPFGGVLADRFDRRLMMIIGDLGSAIGLVFILAFMLLGEPKLWHIYVGMAVSSFFVGIQNPAYKASITDLLTEEQYSKASGLNQLAESSRFLLSPFLAGIMLYHFNIETVLIADIATFGLACLAVLVIKKRMEPSRRDTGTVHWRKELWEGWMTVVTNRGVFLLILIISLVTFFLGFLQTLIGPMVLSFADAWTLGAIQSVCAVGMLVSSLLIGVISVGRRYVEILAAGLIASGVALSLLGMSTNVYFITAAGFVFLAALPFVNMSCDVLVRRNIPNEKQGRVWGIIGILSQFGFIVAYGISGPLADHVFNPLLEAGGPLVSSVGQIIGSGPGRGIGFMFVICGLYVVITAMAAVGVRSIRALAASAAVETGAGRDRVGEPF